MGTESLSNTDLTRFYLPHDLMPDGTNSFRTTGYGNTRDGLQFQTEGQATTRSGLTINGETRHDLQLPDRVYNDKYPRLETGSLTVKLPITEHLHLGYGLTFNQVEDPLNTDRLYDERHERFAPHLTADLQTSTISASTQFDYDPAAYGHGLDVQIAAGHEDSLLKAQFQLEHSRQNITRDKETGDVGAVQAFSIAAVKAGEANLSRAGSQTIAGSLETNFGVFDVGASFAHRRENQEHLYYNGNQGYSWQTQSEATVYLDIDQSSADGDMAVRLGVGRSESQRAHGTRWADPAQDDNHHEGRSRKGIKLEIGFNGTNADETLGYTVTMGYDTKHMNPRRLYQNNSLDRMMGGITESSFVRAQLTYAL